MNNTVATNITNNYSSSFMEPVRMTILYILFVAHVACTLCVPKPPPAPPRPAASSCSTPPHANVTMSVAAP